jgi:hypothetical protein
MKNILILLAASITLVSCGKTFEAPVGYLTVPVYASDIEAVNAVKNAK